MLALPVWYSLPYIISPSTHTYLATNTLFSAISSITVSPDSTLYVADQGNARVRSVGSSLAASGGGDREAEANGVFEVPDPEANQVCNQKKNIVKSRGDGPS